MLSAAGSREASAGINIEKFFSLIKMWLNFALIYALVLLITYYCVETFAVYRFVREQYRLPFFKNIFDNTRKLINDKNFKHKSQYFLKNLILTGRTLLKGLIIIALFAPAYVIAYSFKTRFDTDSVLVMIILGVISNGLLI